MMAENQWLYDDELKALMNVFLREKTFIAETEVHDWSTDRAYKKGLQEVVVGSEILVAIDYWNLFFISQLHYVYYETSW